MLQNRLSTYGKELAFCFSATTDFRSCAALIAHTAHFHAMNAYSRSYTTGESFEINLKIGEGYNTSVSLRTFGGDIFILYEVFMLGSYDIPVSMLPPSEVETIVDCGANIGITSLFFASRYPRARIFSIEPHPDNFKLLKRNVESEKRIVPINAAVVGEAKGKIFFSTNEPAWGNKITQDVGGIEVQAISISQLFERYGLDRIDVLKVDVEGAEEDIFAHAEFLPQVTLGIIELHGNYTQRMFEADIKKWKFTLIRPDIKRGLKMLAFRSNLDSDFVSS
jgi:FkbM family methyltransferase